MIMIVWNHGHKITQLFFLIISHRSLSFGNLKKCSSLCRLLLLLQPKAEQKWPVCLIFSSTRWLHLDRVNPATRGPCRFKFQNGAPLKSYQVKRLGYQGLCYYYRFTSLTRTLVSRMSVKSDHDREQKKREKINRRPIGHSL